jgi:sterol desaturase/sphingolipid hydroxylase (fatty acid hydroxylase superfamily)
MDADTLIRIGVFAGALLALLILEQAFPDRPRLLPRLTRWRTNLALGAASALTVRLMGVVSVAAAAFAATTLDFGVLRLLPDAHSWLLLALSLILLDFAVWAQHVAMHRIPLLWRFHRIHHTDPDLDVTSGLRFHPGEAAASLLWKSAIVFLLGVPLAAALAYEIVLSTMALLTHANIRVPSALDRCLRWVIVTPAMHRIHHSVYRAETDSNYGNALSVWDRLFRTYTPEPRGGRDALTLGIEDCPAGPSTQLRLALRSPFSRN